MNTSVQLITPTSIRRYSMIGKIVLQDGLLMLVSAANSLPNIADLPTFTGLEMLGIQLTR
jgi:hypothetical protein